MDDKELSQDMRFMMQIIKEICDYAVDNNMNPNDTLEAIADNILCMLQISTFENWEKDDK